VNAIVPIPVDDPLQMAWLDCNDLGNAERLKRLARGLLLWIEELGWVAYDGKRWSAEEGELRANQHAHDVARHIDREAAALDAIAEDPQGARGGVRVAGAGRGRPGPGGQAEQACGGVGRRLAHRGDAQAGADQDHAGSTSSTRTRSRSTSRTAPCASSRPKPPEGGGGMRGSTPRTRRPDDADRALRLRPRRRLPRNGSSG
jgi:hypothetical protein